MATNVSITQGPSRSELIDALKYALDQNWHFRVSFSGGYIVTDSHGARTARRVRFTAAILGVSHDEEKKDGFNFNVKAFVDGGDALLKACVVTFSYDAKHRNGNLLIP